MLAGMVNTSFHHNSPFCLLPPITTLSPGLISSSQFFLPSLTNENPSQRQCAALFKKKLLFAAVRLSSSLLTNWSDYLTSIEVR